MVIAIISILAALLLPALSGAQARTQQVGCLNNLKQLVFAVHMYAADNDGRLPVNSPSTQPTVTTNAWIRGSMKITYDSTNQTLIRQSKLFAYASQVANYRCPADLSLTRGMPRTRSYSMNGWMGSRHMEVSSRAHSFRSFLRESELAAAKPSALWVLLDEHEVSIDDGCFPVTMDDSRPFGSYPTMRHSRGYALGFADGHTETYKLRDANSRSFGLADAQITAKNSDWERLKQVTTIR